MSSAWICGNGTPAGKSRKPSSGWGSRAAAYGPGDSTWPGFTPRSHGENKLDRFRSAMGESLEADKRDYTASAVGCARSWCSGESATGPFSAIKWWPGAALAAPEAAIGLAVATGRPVADARAVLRALRRNVSGGWAIRRLGTAELVSASGRESSVFGRALWLQLKPTSCRGALRGGPCGGLVAGKHVPDSHVRSALHSLGSAVVGSAS